MIIKKIYYNSLFIYYNSILILLSFIDIIFSFNKIKFLIVEYQGKSVNIINKSLLVCISDNVYNKYNINIIDLLSNIENPENIIKNFLELSNNNDNISYVKNKITDFFNNDNKNKITDFFNNDDENDDNLSISTTKTFIELENNEDNISIKSSNSLLEL